jgi:hypothetical protein
MRRLLIISVLSVLASAASIFAQAVDETAPTTPTYEEQILETVVLVEALSSEEEAVSYEDAVTQKLLALKICEYQAAMQYRDRIACINSTEKLLLAERRRLRECARQWFAYELGICQGKNVMVPKCGELLICK